MVYMRLDQEAIFDWSMFLYFHAHCKHFKYWAVGGMGTLSGLCLSMFVVSDYYDIHH